MIVANYGQVIVLGYKKVGNISQASHLKTEVVRLQLQGWLSLSSVGDRKAFEPLQWDADPMHPSLRIGILLAMFEI